MLQQQTVISPMLTLPKRYSIQVLYLRHIVPLMFQGPYHGGCPVIPHVNWIYLNDALCIRVHFCKVVFHRACLMSDFR